MFRETGKTEDGAREAGRHEEGKNCGGSQVVSRRELKKYRSPGDTELRRERGTTPTASRARGRLKIRTILPRAAGAHLNVCIHTLVYRFDERCGQNYSN